MLITISKQISRDLDLRYEMFDDQHKNSVKGHETGIDKYT